MEGLIVCIKSAAGMEGLIVCFKATPSIVQVSVGDREVIKVMATCNAMLCVPDNY